VEPGVLRTICLDRTVAALPLYAGGAITRAYWVEVALQP
jgi:hypothetical protein